MKKCKERVDPCVRESTFSSNNESAPNRIVKCAPSSVINCGGRGRSGSRLLSAALLCLSVIIATHLNVVDFGVAAQLAQPIQQISSSLSLNGGGGGGSGPGSVNNINAASPGLTPRHGGNLYAPQHGYDNNIEFIHDQTESIYEVPSQLDSQLDQDDHHQPEDHDEGLNDIPPEIGAGDTYLHNGAPELEPDSDLHHRPHHHLDDDSLNENQLPDEDANEHTSEFTELDGGIIVGERILRQSESPYVLNTDLEIEKGGTLTIEAGVTIEFAPMVGITVRGVISALVSDVFDVI